MYQLFKTKTMKNIFIAAIAATFLFACNQNAPQQSAKSNSETYKKLFNKSMDLKDYHSAIVAIQMKFYFLIVFVYFFDWIHYIRIDESFS